MTDTYKTFADLPLVEDPMSSAIVVGLDPDGHPGQTVQFPLAPILAAAVAAQQAEAGAENWAIKTDGPVEAGEYSAKYHAAASASSASAAAGSEAGAAAQADRAEDAAVLAEDVGFDYWVDNAAALPATGVSAGQTAFQRDTEHIQKYSGSAWVDQGVAPTATKLDKTTFDATISRMPRNSVTLDVNIMPPSWTADTSLNTTTGAPVSSTGWKLSQKMPVTVGQTYRFAVNSGGAPAAAANQYVWWNSSGVAIPGGTSNAVITAPAGAASLQVAFNYASTTAMVVRGSTLPAAFVPYRYIWVTDDPTYPLYFQPTAISAAVAQMSAEVSAALLLAGRVLKPEQMTFAFAVDNLWNPDALISDTYINGVGAPTASTGWRATDFLPVEATQTYRTSFYSTSPTTVPKPAIQAITVQGAWYTAAKVFISTFSGNAAAPSNAAYARISTNSTAYQRVMMTKGVDLPTRYISPAARLDTSKLRIDMAMQPVVQPLYDQTVCTLGDSFTAMNLYTTKLLEVTGMRQVANYGESGQLIRTRADMLYAGIAASATLSSGGSGYTTATVAFSGGGSSPSKVLPTATATISGGAVTAIVFSNQGHDMTVAPTMTISGDGTGAAGTVTLGTTLDGIQNVTLLAGTNDYGHGGSETLGSISDDKSANTVHGSIKYVLDRILTIKPTVKIWVATPIDRGYYAGAPSEPVPPAASPTGLTIENIGQAWIEECRLLAIRCFDLRAVCGVNPYTLSQYLSDGLHWNQVGADIGGTLWGRDINKHAY